MAIVAQREEEMFFDILKAQIVDWRMAEALLARAERLEDDLRTGGLEGFEAAIAADVRLFPRVSHFPASALHVRFTKLVGA